MKRQTLMQSRLLLFSFAAISVGSWLSAQSVDPSEPPMDDDDLIILSVFEVDSTKDDRYRAGNSVSATGLNTAIKDLPMTIQVVTSEFIKDVGATNFDEALSYTSGVFTSNVEASSGGGGRDANNGGGSQERSASTSAGGNSFSNTVSIRGFNVPFQNRLGFRYGGVVITPESNIALGGILDSVNIDRMEVVKGPNSLLYGVGVISGIVNVIPKKPLSVQRNNIGATVGSNGLFRANVDITGPIISGGESGKHRLNYRVMGTYEDRDNWVDYKSSTLRYGAVQLDYWYDSKWNLFAEFQKSHAKVNGTGSQWVYDDLNRSKINEFRNEYYEQYNYAQDGNVPELDTVIFSADPRGRLVSSFSEPSIENRLFEGGTLPDSYRITGPDTYEQRDEENYLLDVSYIPSEHLAFSTGIFFTKADEEEFALNARVLNNLEDSFNIRSGLPANFSAIGENEYAHLLRAVKNVEAGRSPLVANWDETLVQTDDDYKLQRYYWSLRPQRSESFQWRIKGTYNFEIADTKHTILAGYHYINDDVDFLDGDESLNRAFINRTHPYVTEGLISPDDTSTTDALYFRALDDFSIYRYNGENLAMPGEQYLNQNIYFHGAYGVLQSKFFDDRLGLIAGIRYDRYNSENKELIRITEEDLAIGVSNSLYVDNPYSIVYDETEAVKSFEEDISKVSSTFALNYEIMDALTVYGLYSEGLSPNTSLVDGNSDTIPAENTRSIEAGFKWSAWEGKLSGAVAVYEIKRDNAIYRFTRAPAPSKWVDAPESSWPPGHTLDDNGFNPATNDEFVLNYFVEESFLDPVLVQAESDAQLFAAPANNPFPGANVVLRDALTGELHPLYGLLYRRRDHSASSSQPFYRYNYWPVEYDQLDNKQTITFHRRDPDGDIVSGGNTYSLETLNLNWRAYLEEAFSRRDLSSEIIGSYDPIRYIRDTNPFGNNNGSNNPSVHVSAAEDDTFVTFTDKARGVDLEFVYSPTGNLQFIFNYAHTERKAEGAFQMVDWQSHATGEFYGTEYDEIFRIFGRENAGIVGTDTDGDGVNDMFTDIRGNEISLSNPARSTDFYGGIDGLSLFFNPEDEARFWTRYTIDSGPLKRLGFGGGVRYSGPAQTAIPIGGSTLADNFAPTPDASSRTQFDAALYYSFKWMESDWRLSLNVYNLTDDTEGLTTATYDNPYTGDPLTKRTRLLYAPRTFRFSVDVAF